MVFIIVSLSAGKKAKLEIVRILGETHMLSLTDKIAVVTGIGGPSAAPFGNGQQIAKIFAQQGAVIEGSDIDMAAGQITQEQVEAAGGRCVLSKCNVTRETDIQNWIDDILSRHGRIDILVNNVGQSERLSPEDVDQEIWQKQFALNLDSAVMASKAVIPHMKKQGGGVIVNISSIAAIRHLNKPQIAYNAAKAALVQYTRSSAVLLAADKIRMNCVLPGLMYTPMVERMAQKYAGGDYDGFVRMRHNQSPTGEMGNASDVAHAVLFFASDEARYITGTEIVVDGGVTAAITH